MKDYTQKTTKRNTGKLGRMMMLAVLMLCGGMAWAWYPTSAGTYYLRSTGSGNNFKVYSGPNGTGTASDEQTQLNGFTITSGTYTLVFENTNTIIMYGQIFINANANDIAQLVMELGTPPTNQTLALITLKITGAPRQNSSGQDVAFFIAHKDNTDRTKHTITIQGNDDTNSSTTDPLGLSFSNNFVIDGDGPSFETVDGTTMTPKAKVTKAGYRKNYGLFRVQQGTLTLKNVTVQNFCTTWSNAGVIQVAHNSRTAALKVDVNHCYFKDIMGSGANGYVLKLQQITGQAVTNSNVQYRNACITNCEFERIYGYSYPPAAFNVDDVIDNDRSEGCIRSTGNNKTTLALSNCHFKENMCCPIRWHGSGDNTPMTVDNCVIEDSFTGVATNVNGGGGMLLKGPATITKCIIHNNRTNGNGGGIYLSTYTDFNGGTYDLIPEHSILRLDSNTKIYNNIAQGSGGGVAIEAKRMRNPYYYTNTYLNNTDGYIYWTADANGNPVEPFRVEFQQNGGKVYGNTA